MEKLHMNNLKKYWIGIVLISSVISLIFIGGYSLSLMNDTIHSQVLLDEYEYNNAIRDDLSITNAYIKSNLLFLEISYTGGCVNHDFSLIGSGVFAESYPVQTSIILSHEDNNDSCEAILTDTLVFDLTPLKEFYTESYKESSGIINIYLSGYAKLSHLYGWVNLFSYEF